jgi:hypothetical protein
MLCVYLCCARPHAQLGTKNRAQHSVQIGTKSWQTFGAEMLTKLAHTRWF